MNILAIGSHPDDIEFGCGGSLIRFARTGADVYLFIATCGGEGGDTGERRAEQLESARLLGVKDVFWGEYKDTEIPLSKELISRIEAAVRKVEPSLIFAHAREDTHQDHRVLADATLSATRYTRDVLLYEGPSTREFAPTVFIDIGDTFEGKLNALRAHRSQVHKTRIEDLDGITIATANAHFRGVQARLKYAEGFMPVRFLLDPKSLEFSPERSREPTPGGENDRA